MARTRSGDGRSARWQRSALVLLAVATAIGSVGMAAEGMANTGIAELAGCSRRR
jgi:hypothetical protein